MKDIRVSEGVIPLGEFKANAARFLKELDGPIVITQNGRPACVMLSPAEYDRIREQQRFFESVAAGLVDSQAGNFMDTADLKQKLAFAREQRGG